MPTYVALLRGVNIGGRAKIAMADLRDLFVGLGHEQVTTYIQSGNVVFRSRSTSLSKLGAGIEEGIAGELGLDVDVLLRGPGDLQRILDGNPFRRADTKRLHVTFLADRPDPSSTRGLDVASGQDRFEIVGQEVYVHAPDGYGRTKLNNTFFEKRLGVSATTRNWNTVTKLLELAS